MLLVSNTIVEIHDLFSSLQNITSTCRSDLRIYPVLMYSVESISSLI